MWFWPSYKLLTLLYQALGLDDIIHRMNGQFEISISCYA